MLGALPDGMKHHRVTAVAGHLSSVVDGQALVTPLGRPAKRKAVDNLEIRL